MPEGYVRCGERHGLSLDASRYEARARRRARRSETASRARPRRGDLGRVHRARSSSAWAGRARSRTDVAVELTSRWEHHENFELYEDVLPVLEALRAAGLKIGLVSNSARDVRDFARHHALEIDAGISSFHHGKTKPHASIFTAVLDLLEVEPARRRDGRRHVRRRHRRARSRSACAPSSSTASGCTRTTSLGSTTSTRSRPRSACTRPTL